MSTYNLYLFRTALYIYKKLQQISPLWWKIKQDGTLNHSLNVKPDQV